MRKILFSIFTLSLLMACNEGGKKEEFTPEEAPVAELISYETYGKEFSAEGAISGEKLQKDLENLKSGDTLNVKFIGEVKEICQKKGCWVKMDVGEDELMMRFKDYGFFLPKDIAGQKFVANGKAYLEEMSVEAQRHYAEDGGASEEEILAIKEPKLSYTFKADGVLLPERE